MKARGERAARAEGKDTRRRARIGRGRVVME